MSRRIITTQLQAAGLGSETDGYSDRLLKYIPAEVVGAWIAGTGLISGSTGIPTATILWIVFFVMIALAAAWTWRQTSKTGSPPAVTQITIATLAFVVWVFALGGPFATLAFYHPVYGSLVLIVYTLAVPLIVPND